MQVSEAEREQFSSLYCPYVCTSTDMYTCTQVSEAEGDEYLHLNPYHLSYSYLYAPRALLLILLLLRARYRIFVLIRIRILVRR